MTKTARALLSALVVTGRALAARPCLASGFLIYDISGQAIARASAVSADVDEPAAVWFNPANLVYLERVSASAGGVFVSSKSSFSPAGGGAETSTRARQLLPAGDLRERPGHGPRRRRDGRLLDLRHRHHLARRLGGARERDSCLARDADLQPDRRGQGAPANLGGGRLRRRPQRRRFHERLADPDRRRRAVGRAARGATGSMSPALYKIHPGRLHVALTYRSRVKLDFSGRANFSPTNPDFAPVLPDQGGTRLASRSPISSPSA